MRNDPVCFRQMACLEPHSGEQDTRQIQDMFHLIGDTYSWRDTQNKHGQFESLAVHRSNTEAEPYARAYLVQGYMSGKLQNLRHPSHWSNN